MKDGKRNSISLFDSGALPCQEWDCVKNAPVTPHDVAQSSNKSAWWLCSNGHSYSARIANRVKNGTGCPYCSGKRVTAEQSFVSLCPDLFAEWDFDKNSGIDPYSISKGSRRSVWWKCAAGHEWRAAVGDRVLRGTKCNYCRGRLTTQESNAAVNVPEIIEFWDTELNSKSPYEVTVNSSYLVNWRCPRGHVWTSRIHEFLKRRKAKCLTCTSIGVAYPELLKEWDFERNISSDPYKTQPSSMFEAAWVCVRGHKWSSKVANRTRGAGCIRCRSNQTSAPEIRIFSELLWLFEDSESDQSRVKWRSRIEGKEVDIFIPELRLCIEHDGAYYHKNKDDSKKNDFLERLGYSCFRFRESPLGKLRNQDVCYTAGSLSLSDMVQLFSFISKLSDTSIEIKNRIKDYSNLDRFANETGFLQLIQMLPSPLYADSLAALHPTLAEEWDYELNSFSPSEVRQYSTVEVHWKCKNGHSWKAIIRDRVDHGKKCKICNSLAYSSPEIAGEWSEKNFPVTPYMVTRASGRIFWWKCKYGHEWKAAVNARTKAKRPTGCPQCSGVSNQYNSEQR